MTTSISVKFQNGEAAIFRCNSLWTVETVEIRIRSHFDLRGGSIFLDDLPAELQSTLESLEQGEISFTGGKSKIISSGFNYLK